VKFSIKDKQWDDIWIRYKNGESSTQIAKTIGVKDSYICCGLKARGHVLRKGSEAWLRGREPYSKKIQDRKYYENNKERVITRQKTLYAQNPEHYRQKSRNAVSEPPPPGVTSKVCKGCNQDIPLDEYGPRRSGKYQRRPRCKNCENAESKRRRKANPEAAKERDLRYRLKTPVEKKRATRNMAQRKAMRDPVKKLRSTLRKQLLEILKHKGVRRQESALELVGCSVQELKTHLENQFVEGMSWENHGVQRVNGPRKWHIDHITPVDSFDLFDIDQRKQCFHYLNLRPMWGIENIQKSNKILKRSPGSP